MPAIPAGQGTDLGLYDKMLKEWYMSRWIDLLNNQTTTYRLFRRRVVPFSGRQMVIALRTRRTGAVGAVQPSGINAVSQGTSATIDPGFQGSENANVRGKIVMMGIGIPQDVIDQSRNDRGAFYDVVDFEMQGGKVDLSNFLDLMMYKGGATLDPIVTVAGAPTTSAVVTNYYPFYENKRLDGWTTATTGAAAVDGADRHIVSAITRSTRTITFNDFDGLLATHFLYNEGARDINTNFEFTGLEEIVKNSNLLLRNLNGNQFYLGVDRTVENNWQANEIDQNGPLTFNAMQEMCDVIHDNSGGDPTVILTHRATRSEYASKALFGGAAGVVDEQVDARFRWNDTTRSSMGIAPYSEDMHGQSGTDYMRFNGKIPLIVDRYSTHDFDSTGDNGTMYFIDTRHMYVALITDFRWWAPYGRILREAGSSGFGVVAHAYIYGELVNDSPNTCGRIFQIDVARAA